MTKVQLMCMKCEKLFGICEIESDKIPCFHDITIFCNDCIEGIIRYEITHRKQIESWTDL